SLRFGTARPPRFLENSGGKPVSPILGREKTREMLPDDLARLISVDPLRPGVPANYRAVRVQHIDCIIADRIDQQLETLGFAGIVGRRGGAQRHALHRSLSYTPRPGIMRQPSRGFGLDLRVELPALQPSTGTCARA